MAFGVPLQYDREYVLAAIPYVTMAVRNANAPEVFPSCAANKRVRMAADIIGSVPRSTAQVIMPSRENNK